MDKIVVNDLSDIEGIKYMLQYINSVIIPFFVKRSVRDDESVVSREKLTILWINKRKKASKIIKNNGKWPKDESVNITVEENENYYRSIPKFVIRCDFNPNRERYFRSEDVIIQNSELF